MLTGSQCYKQAIIKAKMTWPILFSDACTNAYNTQLKNAYIAYYFDMPTITAFFNFMQ